MERRRRLAAALAFDCGFDSVRHRALWAAVRAAEVATTRTDRAAARTLARVADLPAEVVALLRARGPMLRTQLCERLHVTPNVLVPVLRQMCASGSLVGSGVIRQPYALPPARAVGPRLVARSA